MAKNFLYFDSTVDGYTEAEGFESSEFINSSAGAGDAGKPIVLDAGGLIDGSMIDDSDIDHGGLGGLSDDDHTQYSLVAGTRDYTGIVSYNSHPSFTTDTQIVDKKYVDDLHTGDEWYPYSALDYVTDNTAVPASENSGDVYVLSHDGGTPHANWDGASAGDVVRFNGTTWDATTPTTGTKISIDDETDSVRLWTGSSWDRKYYESTTASTGLTKVGNDIRIDSSAAGVGLGFSAGVLSVNAGDGIEIDGDNVEVDLSATSGLEFSSAELQLADTVAGAGLTISSKVMAVNVDDSTLEIDTDTVRVKADGINDTHIDWGTGANQVSALDVPITDSGGYFTGTEVEAALQELGASIIESGVSYTSAGVTKGDVVYVSANDTAATYATITNNNKAIGLAAATVAASSALTVLANDTVCAGVLSGATAGDIYYWNGTALTATAPTGTGQWVIQAGVAKNATDLHVECRTIKKNT